MKLNRKIALLFSLIIIVFAGLLIMFDGLFLESYYIGKTKNTLKKINNEISTYVENNTFSNTNQLVIYVNDVGDKNGVTVCLFDTTGKNVDAYKEGSIPNLASIFNSADEIGDGLSFKLILEPSKSENISYVSKLMKSNTLIGYILIYKPITILQENISLFRSFVLYISAILIIVAILLSFVVSNRITKPIKEAEVKTKKMAELDFSDKLDESYNDEIGSLSSSINKMSDELEKNIVELQEANKKLEEDINFKEKVGKIREEFISDVSHELKTPISIISGYSEALKLEGLTPDEINEYADIIIDESQRMNKLVRDLLKFSQIESGMIELEKEDFRLKDMLDMVLNPYDLKLKDKQIKLNISVDDIIVNGDYDMLSTVLNNFFINAINYVNEDRIINLTGSMVNGKYRISVYNSGQNISEENIDRIWDSFYKADKARSRKYGGSGLGLSIVKTIMDLYKNEFGVVNEKEGVTFFFDMNIGGI